MKILFLSHNFPPESNAAANRVFERAVYWVRWGHQVTVITCHPNFPEGKIYPGYRNRWRSIETVDGIRVIRVKTLPTPNAGVAGRTFGFLFFMVAAFFAGLLEKKPDVVTATSPQFFTAVAGYAVAAVKRSPFVFELGDLWPASIAAVGAMKKGALLGAIERLELYLYHKSAAVIALTQAFKDNLVGRRIDPDKIDVVINGVDLARYEPCAPDEELAASLGLKGKMVVGYIGTLGMAHALDNVVRAAGGVTDNDQIRFLFVGPGAAREGLMRQAKEKGLTNVLFIDRRPKEETPRYWSLVDVALVHLKDDPVFAGVIPSKIFEAMAMGKPIIMAAPQGEATSIVETTGAGLVIPPEDPASLVSAVTDLFKDQEERARLGAASRGAASLYSRERQARLALATLERAGRG